MATFNKFNSFTTKLGESMNLSSDTIKVMLTNTEPNGATDESYSDISGNEVADGNGYTTGGETSAVVSWDDSQSAGTAELVLTDVSWTASAGTIGPFQYAVCYDSTTGDLIGYHSYTSSITLQIGETFDWDTAAAGTGFIKVGP
jgi:hypothetical protein